MSVHTAIGLWSALCLALSALGPAHASAQDVPRLVRVEGLTFDSLTRRPLPDAFVAVAGTGRSTTSDSKGRFRLDSVPEGEQTLTMQHAAFDSLGLSGASARVTVRNRMPRVVLAVPSFATLWRAACGDMPAPADSALIYGSARSADGTTNIGRGSVEVSWVDLVGGGRSLTTLGQRRWRRTTETDERGEFALCGVAAGVPLELRVSSSPGDSVGSTTLQLAATNARVRRHDVRLAPLPSAVVDSAVAASGGRPGEGPPMASGSAERRLTGTVTGIVTSAEGVPLANAIVAVDSLVEMRSGPDGRFRVDGVGAGTRQALVVAVGMSPQTITLDVSPGATTEVIITMQPVQQLNAVEVRANASTIAGLRRLTFEEHKRSGIGDFRDSTDFVGQNNIVTALRMVPGLTVRVARGGELEASSASCPSMRFVVDGHPSSSSEVLMQQPAELAAMEIFKRRLLYPMDANPCTILLWTKAAFGR